MHGTAQALGQQLPAIPVVFRKAILDRNDRITAHQLGQLIHHFGAAVVAAAKAIAAVFVELGAGHIKGQGNLLTRFVAGFLNGANQQVAGGIVAIKVWGKTAFITHGGGKALFVQQTLEGVEHFGTPAQGFAEAAGAMGNDHELLEIQVVGGMLAAIDHVHQRYREHRGRRAAQVAVQRQAHAIGSCTGHGHAHGQDGIGSQAGFVGAAIEFIHGGIDRALIQGTQSAEGRCQPLFHIADGLVDSLAEVTHGVAIAQLMGFVGTGAGTAGHNRPATSASLKQYLGFDRWGAAGVQDFPCHHGVDHKVERVEHSGLIWRAHYADGPCTMSAVIATNAPCVCCTPCFGWAIWSAPSPSTPKCSR